MPRSASTTQTVDDGTATAMNITVDAGFAVLLVVCGTRYFSYHPFDERGFAVLLLALGSGAAYAVAVLGRAGPLRRKIGILLATALWLPLAIMAPSFGWCAFALFFAVHRVLPRPAARIVSGGIVVAVSAGLFLMSEGHDPGLVLGPFFGGLVLSFAYDALERALENRRRLIDELVDARARLDRSEREAGALAERNRVASELHDTVVQRTASALLLLESDGEAAGRAPNAVAEARDVLREALAETRQLLHGLARPREERPSLAEALRELADEHGAEFGVVGEERDPGADASHALLRVAQEALVNVEKHARASSVRVTLTFFEGAVGIDVVDDGAGFRVPERSGGVGGGVGVAEAGAAEAEGYGLRAMAWRVESLGGSFAVESRPGRGTAVAGIVPSAAEARGASGSAT